MAYLILGFLLFTQVMTGNFCKNLEGTVNGSTMNSILVIMVGVTITFFKWYQIYKLWKSPTSLENALIRAVQKAQLSDAKLLWLISGILELRHLTEEERNTLIGNFVESVKNQRFGVPDHNPNLPVVKSRPIGVHL